MNDRRAETVYRRFIELLSSGRMDEMAEVVDLERYRENCVGVTPGWVDWRDALQSYGQHIYAALPDIRLDIEEVATAGDLAVARGSATATHTGAPLLGVPPSGRPVRYELCDMVRVGDDGRISWRWLLCDLLTATRQARGEPAPGGAA